MAWRNCGASLALIDEVNKRWPGRSRVSDGTIGDAAHASRTSDHNPWIVVAGQGVVRARDITANGINVAWLAEHLRALGAAGDNRLGGGGYLIFNRRITTTDWRGWKTYTGTNPHVSHLHVSFSRNTAGFDSPRPWGIWPATASGGDWFDMATREDLAAVIRAELGRTIYETTQPLPNRRGPGGSNLKDAGGDTLFGYTMNADGFGYRIEQKLDQLIALVKAAGVDPTAVQNAITQALGGGLDITGTATPKRTQ